MAKIEFLGKLSDICGEPQNISLPEDISTIASLRNWLNSTFEGAPLAPKSIRAIVNGNVAADTQTISNTDVIAFFPPVGGG